MRVVAIGRDRICDGDGTPLDPAVITEGLNDDEFVVVHDGNAHLDHRAHHQIPPPF